MRLSKTRTGHSLFFCDAHRRTLHDGARGRGPFWSRSGTLLFRTTLLLQSGFPPSCRKFRDEARGHANSRVSQTCISIHDEASTRNPHCESGPPSTLLITPRIYLPDLCTISQSLAHQPTLPRNPPSCPTSSRRSSRSRPTLPRTASSS